jgi:AraC-like DNA-binding protein
LTPIVFGVAASDLVDQIVPLQDLWPGNDVERILAFSQFETGRCVSALKDELVARIRWADRTALLGQTAPGIIKRHAGNISIEDLASNHGLTRQRFARTFTASTGLSPKLFARITRFQALVHALLSTDVSQWASMSSAVGFYDQAHMINEFRTFTGSPPRVFFLPHGANIDLARVQLHGRPSEWSYQLDQRTERASA